MNLVARFLLSPRCSKERWPVARGLSRAVRLTGLARRSPITLMKRRIFTVPNQLTFLRLAFLPFFIIAINYDRYALALGILLVAGFTDALDGLLARELNQKTPLGAYLDPIADKLLLSSSYLVLALKGKIAWWLAIMVLGRDVLLLVACAVILLTVGYRPFPPSIGESDHVFRDSIGCSGAAARRLGRARAIILRRSCGYFVAAFVILSGFHYSIVVSRRLRAGD